MLEVVDHRGMKHPSEGSQFRSKSQFARRLLYMILITLSMGVCSLGVRVEENAGVQSSDEQLVSATLKPLSCCSYWTYSNAVHTSGLSPSENSSAGGGQGAISAPPHLRTFFSNIFIIEPESMA